MFFITVKKSHKKIHFKKHVCEATHSLRQIVSQSDIHGISKHYTSFSMPKGSNLKVLLLDNLLFLSSLLYIVSSFFYKTSFKVLAGYPISTSIFLSYVIVLRINRMQEQETN